MKKLFKKIGGNVMEGARVINKATGGEDLSKYFGEKLARMVAKPETKKYVSQTVTGKDALKSAGKVGLSIATVTGLGGMAAGAGKAAVAGASKAKGMAQAIKGIVKSAKVGANSKNATLKRILAKHKAGGDAKMLSKLKEADPNVGRKLPVKSNPLDKVSFKNEPKDIKLDPSKYDWFDKNPELV